MNAITIGMAGRKLTPGEWLMLLGVAHYGPRKHLQPLGMTGAASAFDNIVTIASKRGFKERKQLISAMRKGNASQAALARCDGVCQLLTPAELAHQVGVASRSIELMSGASS